MSNFSKWDKYFRAQNLYVFNHNANALLWLKTRAICRKEHINRFLQTNGIILTATKLADKHAELFEKLETSPNGMAILDSYLKIKNNEWYETMGVDEEILKSDLYKIQSYVWGGDQRNSLDKHLVSRYVKMIFNYDDLITKQEEIANNAWNYVQISWYNNWTSYLIESLFKRHEKVISAIGEIKSVDFFVDDNPIDLKVTFFPNQYMDDKLKEKLGKKGLPWLKSRAKEVGINVDSNLSQQLQENKLREELEYLGHKAIIDEFNAKQKEVVFNAQKNPHELMKWLYTNQGEMRFGAENRLYLILVDTTDFRESWKMKRAFKLIEPKINDYLNRFNDNSLKEISFNFNGKHYKSLSDILFIIKE